MDNKKGYFLKARNFLEHKLSNKVKNATGNDLFDCLSLVVLFGGGVIFILVLMYRDLIKVSDGATAFVLWFTAYAIFRYTKETYWLKKINQKLLDHQRENSLRPIILRSGIIKDWSKVQYKIIDNQIHGGTILKFSVLKNIAQSITGYIIINNKKYQLLFASEDSRIHKLIYYFPNWEWIKPDNILYAIHKGEGEYTGEKNKIFISYKDIEGNEYHTVEDRNFLQRSYKNKNTLKS